MFLGSEITALATGPAGTDVKRNVALLIRRGTIRMYGGAIRVLADPGVTVDSSGVWYDGMLAVSTATPDAEIHIHGTGIDMISAGPNKLRAISMDGGGMVHANGAAYMLKTGAGGQRHRVFDPGFALSHVMAPYVWEPMPSPPGILSLTGQDTIVVTDTADGKPHTLVYAASCGSHWFDNNENSCYVP